MGKGDSRGQLLSLYPDQEVNYMDRPTTEIVLPISKTKVILYSYLTYGEMRKIRRKVLETLNVDVGADRSQIGLQSISGSVAADMQEQTLNSLIAEVYTGNGEKVEDKIAFVDNLPSQDGDHLYQKVDELTKSSSLTEESKKK